MNQYEAELRPIFDHPMCRCALVPIYCPPPWASMITIEANSVTEAIEILLELASGRV